MYYSKWMMLYNYIVLFLIKILIAFQFYELFHFLTNIITFFTDIK